MNRLFFLLILYLFFISPSVFPQNFGVESYVNAHRNYSVGDYNKAIKYYDEYLSAYSSDAQAFSERGRCYESLMQYDNALKDYSTAISLKPSFAEYYRNRGYVYIKTGKPDLALNDFNKSVLYNPNDAYSYSARSIAYIHLRNFDFALKDINTAMQFEPTNAGYLITRGTIYGAMDDTLNLFKAIDTILTFNPAKFFSSFKSQDVIIYHINFNNTITALTENLIKNPENDFVYFKRGLHYYILSKFDAALKDFEMCKKYAGNKPRMLEFSDRFIKNIKQYGDL
jgi:tetratricopeptide (TPR) repeat protein